MFFPLISKKNESKQGKKSSVLFIILCLAIFLMNGIVSIISKAHQISEMPKVDSLSFVILNNSFKFIVGGIALIIICCVRKEKPKLAEGYPTVRFLGNLVIYSGFNGCSYLLQLKVAASDLPASVQYPMLTGGSIVLTAIAGILIFKEKPSKFAIIDLCITFAATFLFLI